MGGMTFGSLFKKPETTLYPVETKQAPAGLKGHIHNEVDKSIRRWAIDPFRCVQCGSCVRACPKACLHMLPTYTKVSTTQFCNVFDVPDPNKPKPAEVKKASLDWDYSEPDKHGLVEK